MTQHLAPRPNPLALNRVINVPLEIPKECPIRSSRPSLSRSGAAFLCCVSLAASPKLIAQQSQEAPAQTTPPVIKANVNEVLVPVVVRDSRGRAVSSLSKDDFQVFDNGKPQALTGFTIVKRATATAEANASTANPVTATSPATPQLTSSPQRFVIFLFDDFNFSFADLAQAQEAATKALDSSLAPTDIAAVLSTSGTNSGFTRDRAKLKQAILGLRVKGLYHHDEHECPNVDYYQGDRILNKNDSMAFQAAVADVMSCSSVSEPSVAETMARNAAQRAVELGEQNYRSNLDFLKIVLNQMGPLPGQHVLILVSSGFLTPDAEAMSDKSNILDIASRANVVINTLDARGLYTTNQDASAPTRTDPATQRLLDQYRRESMAANQDVLAELADGTGGTFFRNNNDLEAGLATLISGPEYLYLLAFSNANMKSNGAYHNLKVKVNQPGLAIQARRGYFAPASGKGKK
jgi:VWFA-related protein